MNGYDFDKTIYDGDSFLDFYFYSLIRRPFLLIFLPSYLLIFLLYLCKLFTKKEIKEFCMFNLKFYKNKTKLVEKFWDKHIHKIKKWYLAQKQFDDVIISASPEFLIDIACKRIEIKNVIGTKMNIETQKIEGENCYGKEKVNRFKKLYENVTLQNFYSDSLSDMPMMEISKHGYLVRGEKISKIYDM